MNTPEVDHLADEIAELSAHIDAATHRFLTLIARFDEIEGWAEHGARTCAHWLSWRVGLDLGAAREHVRVARALRELPQIDDALRHGRVSYSKVRALTRVAMPENEGHLLEDGARIDGVAARAHLPRLSARRPQCHARDVGR